MICARLRRVKFAVFVAHRRGRDTQRAVVERADDRVGVDEQPWLAELLGECAGFAATGDGGQVVEVHAKVEFAALAVVGDGNDLTRLGVITYWR